MLDSEVERWVHARLWHVPVLLCRSGQGQTQRNCGALSPETLPNMLVALALLPSESLCQRFMGFSMNGKFASGAAEQEEAESRCRRRKRSQFGVELSREATMKAFLQEYGAQCAGFPEGRDCRYESCPRFPPSPPNSRRGPERNSSFSRNGREDSC